MVWSALARFGRTLVTGAQGLKGTATVAGTNAKIAYQTGGVRTGIAAFKDSAKVQWALAGKTPGAQRAMLTTLGTGAASVPLLNGLFNSGSQVPQGYPQGYR